MNSDVVSTSSIIKFDIQADGQEEATLDSTGLKIGEGTANANLHINGNTIISESLSIGGTSLGSSNINLNGTISLSNSLISTSGTLTMNHSVVLLDTGSSGDLNIDLPDAALHEGKIITIKKIGSGNQVLLGSSSNIDIDQRMILDNNEHTTLISADSTWYILKISPDALALSTNLQFYLNFNDDLNDASGYYNHGSISANTYNGVSDNGGVTISELGDVIEVDTSSTLDFTDAVTLSLWVKPNSIEASHQSFSGWTDLLSPYPSGINDDQNPGEIAFTLIGNTYAFLSYQHQNITEYMDYSLSDRQFNGISWTSMANTGRSQSGEASSIALDSDGKKLIASAFTHTNATESYAMGTFDDDFSNFSGWIEMEPPDGAGGFEPSFIDAVVVDGNIHLAAFLHNSTNETVSLTQIDNALAAGNVTWSVPSGASSIDDAGASGESASVAIDSDGQNLYYAFFTTTGTSEHLYIASSNLDGSGFAVNEYSTDDPDGAEADFSSHIAMSLLGSKLHYAIALSNSNSVEVFTSSSNLDGSGLAAFTSRGTVYGAIESTESVSLDMASAGCNIQILSYSGNQSSSNLMVGTLELANTAPLLSKGDAFTLNYTGGGFVLDWAGSPKSFGSLTADTFHHVALTYDGDTMKFYIDGQLKRTQTVDRDFLTNSDNLLIGGDDQRYFDGTIDDVRFFNSSLNSSDISELYQLGR